jgi:hypothetical protein
MSRYIIFVSMYHRHKLLDLIDIHIFLLQVRAFKLEDGGTTNSYST